jgi:hypothetical protein
MEVIPQGIAKAMRNNQLLRKLTPLWVYLNAAIWVGLGLLVALKLHPAVPDEPIIRWGMAILSLLTGGLIIALHRLSRRWRRAYFLLVGMVVAISFLAFADDFGVVDLVALIINLLAMVLLIVNRDDYLIPDVD